MKKKRCKNGFPFFLKKKTGFYLECLNWTKMDVATLENCFYFLLPLFVCWMSFYIGDERTLEDLILADE